MKQLVVISLAVFSGLSLGRSIQLPIPTVRLQVGSQSLHEFHHLPVGEQRATVIRVNSFGLVTGSRCTAVQNIRTFGAPVRYTNCHLTQKLDTLSRFEMRQMEVQIREARVGTIVYPDPGGIHCLAMPNRSFTYTADAGRILLKSGAEPCSAVTYNNSKSAKSLVSTLDGYRSQYAKLIGGDLE